MDNGIRTQNGGRREETPSPGRHPAGDDGEAETPDGGGRPAWTVPLVTAGALSYVLSLVLARFPGLVEAVYIPWVVGTALPPLSRLTGVVPFALAEVAVLGYLLWRIRTAGRGLVAIRRGDASRKRILARGAWLLARDVGAAVLLFYLVWGFSYARRPAGERLELPVLEAGGSGALLERLAEETVEEANRRYRALHGTDDAGRPTTMPPSLEPLMAPLARGWDATAADLELGPEARARFGRPKPALISPLLARLGLVGFYFPFTAEAVVNVEVPAVALAATVAHEQAHQRGVTNEGDATFLGHLAALRSGDPLLRYSAAVRAQTRFLAALDRRDPERADELRDARLPGVRRDLEDLAAYIRRHRGPAREVARQVNDAYLRANQVPGGVESYGHVTDLLLRYGALRGGLFGEKADGSR